MYFVLLKLWTVLGTSEAALRSLSVAASVATVPVVYVLARRLVGARAALLALVVLAVNVYFIRWSQDARVYTLLVLLVSASTLGFERAIRVGSTRAWALYAGLVAVGFYAHLYAAFIPVAHYVSLIFLRRDAVRWRQALSSALAIALAFVPIGAYAIGDLGSSGGHLGWVPPLTSGTVPELITSFTNNSRSVRSSLPIVAAYAVPGVAALIFALHVWRRRWGSDESWRLALLASWLLAPIAIAVAISVVKPVFWHRFLIVSLPPFLVLTGLGLDRLGARWPVMLERRIQQTALGRLPPLIMGLSTVAIVSLSLVAVVRWYESPAIEDWRGAIGTLLREASSDDAVIFYISFSEVALDYYADGTGTADLPQTAFYAGPAAPDQPDDDTRHWRRTGEPTDPSLGDRLAARFDRVFLFLSHADTHDGTGLVKVDAIKESLRAHYVETVTFEDSDFLILRFDRSSATVDSSVRQ